MTSSTPYSVPHEPGRWRAIALAAVVHAALFAFFWIGIRWQNEKPLAVEAEIWSPSTQEAAPVAAPAIPQPEPPPEKVLEKPAPEPIPEPTLAPRHMVVTPPAAKPDIALEQEKKRKARQEELAQAQQLEQERLAKKQHEKELLKEELLKEKLAQKQKEKELLKQAQKEKAAAQKQAEKEKEKEKALAQKKHAEEEASKTAAAAQDKKHKQELAKKAALANAAEDAKLAKLRDAEMHRMTGGTSSATVTGSGGNGSAAKSQGNRGDPGYGDRIKGKIKSNTIFNVPGDLNGNPAAVYEVSLLPDGTIRSLRLKKSSGVAGFDEAVRRGIEKSEPYPKDKSGEVPPSFDLTYKPKD